jgi:hypothetical protein
MAVHPSWRKAKGKPTKAKSKTKAPAKAEPPDWLRKAMAVKPTKPKVGRKPDAIKAKFKAITAKARRKKMIISKDKPLPDPTLDPDFGAAEEQVKIPEEQRTKGTKLTEEPEPEVEPLYDEVAAGEEIPAENAEAFIAGTLGGTGDHHASAKRILERMANEANWVINKGADGTPAGMAIKARKEAEERNRKDAKGRGKNDPKGADDQKADKK